MFPLELLAFSVRVRQDECMTKNTGKRGMMREFSTDEKVWLAQYMHGFSKNIKKGDEALYISVRTYQLIWGIKRIAGMSAEYGLSKQRGRSLEMVTLKVWKAGLAKLALQGALDSAVAA